MPVADVSRRTVASTPAQPPRSKLPSAKDLNNVLGAWAFHKQNSPNGVWSTTKKPAALKPDNILKSYVLSKPKPGIMGGATIRAYVLKNQPNMVIYEKSQALAPPNNFKYFGPVRNDLAPK